jgi:hypothetical protein
MKRIFASFPACIISGAGWYGVLSWVMLPSLLWGEESQGAISFNRDIRPFLADACFQCHGPDANTREAGLRLDDAVSAQADRGDGRVAIWPGNAAESEAVRRIYSDDPAEQMPPPESGLKLSQAQKESFRQWVAAGAVYEKHWAFLPIIQPKVVVADAEHPIDALIRQPLAALGLRPSPLAPAETQLRRVSLDLTGLPPSLNELDQYLAEIELHGQEAAYSQAVDRLLKSPRYGERMAWSWLEAARYADTDGYQNDGHRDMWRWRDWVIEAFNEGMPFDQFTIEQLAGDLLPDPSHRQLIATGFNRNHRYNSEEGIPIDEFLLENAVDRVDTTATVWMAMTAGCARCHDHKFDPLNQREYYQLIDYFNDVAESGRAIKFGNSEPWIKTPTDEQRAQLGQLDQRVQRARKALSSQEADLVAGQRAWEKSAVVDTPVLKHGLDHYFDFEDEQQLNLAGSEARLVEGVRGQAIQLRQESHASLGKIEGLVGNGRHSIAFWLKPDEVERGPVLSNEAANTRREGILVEFVDGRLRWNINTRWISGVSTIETVARLQPGEWVHVTLTNDGTQRAAGMRIYLHGVRQAVTVIRNTNSNSAARDFGDQMQLGHSQHVGYWSGEIDDLRFYTRRTLSPEEIDWLAEPASLDEILKLPPAARSPRQAEWLRIAYLEQGANPTQRESWEALLEARAKRTAYHDSLPTTMIMRDLLEPRPSYVRIRGVYDALGEKVASGVPAFLPPLPAGESNSRLALARWLVSPEHPLTGRVIVNRLWQMLFGAGLVRTTEDFGTQGEPPSHPELLDWLAAEFIAQGWDMKKILKTMVMSHTYRQSSHLEPEHRQLDPNNRWLARAPRLRLPGNVLRDQALYLSGLLVEKQGGPSVFPYQPARLWEEASNAKYTVGKGADLYRRSLYTYWKRTLSPPTMAVLDNTDRESCSVRPKATNTPLQALTLLNEVTFVEAARKLGEWSVLAAHSQDRERIAIAFRKATARWPTETEEGLLVKALDTYRQAFSQQPTAAKALLQVGQAPAISSVPEAEQAAWTSLANVILNLDEVTTRE